jgi:AmmeMemoRadiSam system protein B
MGYILREFFIKGVNMRKASVAGSFYPASCNEIEKYIEYFNEVLDKNIEEKDRKLFELKPKAVIVPHAGWIYSGFTANFVYRMTKNFEEKRVILIGPSHKIAYEGASICLEDEYESPCKNLKIDIEYSTILQKKFDLINLPAAHLEHSTEVQVPFIAHYIKNAELVEIIYSDYSPAKLSEVINFLLEDEKNLIIISSDLSHYYDKKTAMALDYHCLEAVHDLDEKMLEKCEACGKIGIEAIIQSSKISNLTPLIVDYRTSADASGDENQVVGYMSAIFV